MVAETLAPERDFRGPGCGPDCRAIRALLPGQFGRSELMLHDPVAHEEFGRRSAGFRPDGTDVFATGRLTIDLLAWEVAVDGAPVRLTPTAHRVLRALACRAGTVVTKEALLREVWGEEYADPAFALGNGHMVRVAMARLRQGLGPSETLIRTIVGIGYRLEVIEVGRDLPAQPRNPSWNKRLTNWARQWSQCRDCGTVTRPHASHGYCGHCRWRSARRSPIGGDS